MLPKPSFCLNIPKTGTTFTDFFLNAADWLELKRLCRLNDLTVPHHSTLKILKAIKRYGFPFGNLNCRVWTGHAGYSMLPDDLKAYPKLCALRDIKSWYCSSYLYYTHAMTNNLLSKAIRLLVDNDDNGKWDANTRTLLFRHRQEFVDRFKSEDASTQSLENLSVEFFIWFTQTIRRSVKMKKLVGLDSFPHPMGFLTFRTIVMLFDDPPKIFGLTAAALQEYFASGHYLQDIKCDFFLDFDNLTEQLCAVMIDKLGYPRESVTFLKESVDKRNTSPPSKKGRVMQALAQSSLFADIHKNEAIYERYLLPLAGSRHPSHPVQEMDW